MTSKSTALPQGVELRDLQPHLDDRGTFTELYRGQWGEDDRFVQWNAVKSEAGVLRGVHVHHTHDDYLSVVDGRAFVGLSDLRPSSESYRAAACVELTGERPQAILIPHGVAHGFYFPERALHVYAVSHYWDPEDELGCRWDDPATGIAWPALEARVSERDAALPSLAVLVEQLRDQATTRTA